MFTGSFQLRASSVPRLRARQLCYSVASALMTNICVNLGHFQHRQDVPILRISVMVFGDVWRWVTFLHTNQNQVLLQHSNIVEYRMHIADAKLHFPKLVRSKLSESLREILFWH